MTDHPLIITCALVGAELTRDVCPCLPLTPEEIAEAAEEAVAAGATIIHLHVRDKKGRPTQDTEVFKKVTDAVRNRCDCILQYSTGGAVGTPVEDRIAPLRLKPDMASLSLGTINFGPDIFENKEETIKALSSAMKRYGVVPELEIFDPAMLDTRSRLMKQGVISDHHHVNFVLGVPGGLGGSIENLVFLVNRLEPGRTWSVAGVGKHQLPLSVHAVAMGGHVRTGLEDNIYYRKHEPARSNAQLVEQVVQIARYLDRPVASLAQAKTLLQV